MSDAPPSAPLLTWPGPGGQPRQAAWRSLAGHPPPQTLQAVDDSLDAGTALRLLRQGTGLVWQGDYHQARQMLSALGRRLERQADRPAGRRPDPRRSPGAPQAATAGDSSAEALGAIFLAQRRDEARRARLLGGLLVPVQADHAVPLRRAPDLREAGLAAHGPVDGPYLQSLRELLGLVGAWEWRRRGVPVPALDASIHPHHGVFAPVRGEYVDLVAQAPLPAAATSAGALDIGTGTGVLAAVLARRGLAVLATDLNPTALANAADTLARLGLQAGVRLQPGQPDTLYPPDAGPWGLVVCNPPWVPVPAALAAPGPLAPAVHDADSAMLRAFLAGLAAALVPGGEGWLLLSDLAEHLGLRPRAQLLGWIEAGGLRVLGRLDTRPRHRRAADPADPLHAARAAETTSLWRLARA